MLLLPDKNWNTPLEIFEGVTKKRFLCGKRSIINCTEAHLNPNFIQFLFLDLYQKKCP